MTVHVFSGPTLRREEVRAALPAAVPHPPIRHGDALRLGAGPGDVVLIVDGVFHQSASVRHKEILELMAVGATVVGCSSMGALRAAELDVYGMIGVGEVYAMYRDGVIDADADVAVTHTEGPPAGGDVEQLSAAMVDLECLLFQARRAGVVDEAERAAVAAALREVHYTERSPRRLAALEVPGMAAFRSWSAGQADLRGAKQRDALDALRLLAEGRIEPVAPGPWAEQEWRTEYLRGWSERHTGTVLDGRYVSRLAVTQYRQIFDAGYPERWRSRVLAWIAGGLEPDGRSAGQPAEAALNAAADSGLRLGDLTADQRRHWLTAVEDTTLDDAEALVRILVRSVGCGPTAPGSAGPEPDAAVVAGVVRAYAANDRAAELGVEVHELDAGAVRQYLRRRWGLGGAAEEDCNAAARDRGFRSFDGAVGICRQFILAELGEGLWRHLGAASGPSVP